MIRSFLKLQGMSASFQNDKILTAFVYMGGTTYLTPEPRLRFLERLEAELRRLKNVIAEITAENLELKKGLSE